MAAFDEKLELPTSYFDCIFFNDVLEHMIEPAIALRAAQKLLVSGGKIAASIPSMAHFPTFWPRVVREQWEYTERGILDRTHLLFFTPRSICQLFEAAGFSIEQLCGINEFVRMQSGDHQIWKFYRMLSLIPGFAHPERALSAICRPGWTTPLKT